MVTRTIVTSKVPIAFRTEDYIARECARGAGHTVATRLVAGVRDNTCTRFVANFIYVSSIHGSSKKSDHVIMSFAIIVEYIKTFRGVYLPFKHDVFAAQTVVDNYLIFPKVFLETDDLGDPRSVGQI